MGRGWAAGSVDEEEKGGWRGCWATREGRERLFGGWVSIVVLGIAARRAAVGIADAYRRTFRDTECGSLTASWDGYRWWLMTGDHGDAMAGPSLGVGRRVCPAWNWRPAWSTDSDRGPRRSDQHRIGPGNSIHPI
jgi:hypothetical protein